jgi:Zn-finger nucleic acid-binding protein
VREEDLGYDKEEEYFHRKNQELLAKKRAELDAQRRDQEAGQLKELHWLRCPKCGQQMVEEDRSGIKVDRCGGCGGVFFDQGELELLLEAEEPAGFLSSLRRRLKG